MGKMPDMPAMAEPPSLYLMLADSAQSRSHLQALEQVVKLTAQSGLVRRSFWLDF